jgi:hypothetical protein
VWQINVFAVAIDQRLLATDENLHLSARIVRLEFDGRPFRVAGLGAPCGYYVSKGQNQYQAAEVGRATPCAPGFGNMANGAHGVKRPTFSFRGGLAHIR